jgi:hypothetical protein
MLFDATPALRLKRFRAYTVSQWHRKVNKRPTVIRHNSIRHEIDMEQVRSLWPPGLK